MALCMQSVAFIYEISIVCKMNDDLEHVLRHRNSPKAFSAFRC